MTSTDTELEALAARRGGLVLTRDLVRAGLTDDEIRWVTRPLHRIRSGAYSLTEPADAAHRHALLVRAVVLRHHQQVAASHVSAALLHDLPLWDVPLHLAHVTGVEHVRRGVRHRAHTHAGPLPPKDLVRMDGIHVTAVPRTLLDCARVLPLDQAVAITDHALHHGLATRSLLTKRAEAPVPGIERARRVLSLADARAETVGETRTRLILVRAGIRVEPQVTIRDSEGRFLARVDMVVDGYPVVTEFDGRAKYQLNGDVERAHWEEKQRHDALNDAGYLVVRVTWRELDDPARVVTKVRAGIARAKTLGL